MQVAAHTNGRDSINKFDCLLLQHILWQRPEESQRIIDFLLERLAIESSTQQTDYLFDGAPPESSVFPADFGMRTATDLCTASTRTMHALLHSSHCNLMGVMRPMLHVLRRLNVLVGRSLHKELLCLLVRQIP